MSKWMKFKIDFLAGKKKITKTIKVYDRSESFVLGIIKWSAQWRQYAFYPEANCLFSEGCLQDIRDEINTLMEERKLRRKEC